MTSGVFHCLHLANRIHRSLPRAEWPAAIDAIPGECAQPDRCTRDGCQAVVRAYLRGIDARRRVWAELRARRAAEGRA